MRLKKGKLELQIFYCRLILAILVFVSLNITTKKKLLNTIDFRGNTKILS